MATGSHRQLADIKRRFHNGWLNFHPSQAVFLGDPSGRLRFADVSEESVAKEVAFLRRTLAEIAAVDPIGLTRPERVDRRQVERLCTFMLDRYVGRREHLCTVGMIPFPTSLISYELMQAGNVKDWKSALTRAADIPRFLDQAIAVLRRGVEVGVTADRGRTEAVIAEAEQAVQFFSKFEDAYEKSSSRVGYRFSDADHRVLAAAGDAYRRVVDFLRATYLAKTSEAWSIGRAEFVRRLRDIFGVTATPEELVAQAESELAAIHTEMIALADRMTPGTKVIDIEGVAKVLENSAGGHGKTKREVLDMYRAQVDRVLAHLRKTEIYDIPPGFEVIVTEAPVGYKDADAGNLNARLHDPSKKAIFVVRLDVPFERHPRNFAIVLAVHEGPPGHALQSAQWQHRFANDDAPVRFYLVSDLMNKWIGHWGTNLNIEGYALACEARMMREPGLYNDAELLYALLAQALRCVRVIVDVGLHAQQMSPERAMRLLQEKAFASPASARDQLERYKAYPTQASTYLIGRLQIESLKRKWLAQDKSRTEADFHRRFLDYGPIAPSLIAQSMLRDKRSDR